MECGLLLSESSQQRSTCERLFMGFCRFTVCMVGYLLGSLFYFCCAEGRGDAQRHDCEIAETPSERR